MNWFAQTLRTDKMLRWMKRVQQSIDDLSSVFKGCNTFLDLGCGTSNPFPSLRPKYLVGVDGFLPYLLRASKYKTHDDFVLADLRQPPFKSKSVDCAFAFDVIEHLSKHDGGSFLQTLEDIARKRVVLITPNGFNPKPKAEDSNPMQLHLSGWEPEEFRRRGYRVRGRMGIRLFRGPYAKVRWRPKILWEAISYYTQPLAMALPQTAFHLLAYKDVSTLVALYRRELVGLIIVKLV